LFGAAVAAVGAVVAPAAPLVIGTRQQRRTALSSSAWLAFKVSR
jgi:hypothetical protein